MKDNGNWELLQDQYCIDGEKTFDEVIDRVTKFLYKDSPLPKRDKDFISECLHGKLISVNSPLLMNAGRSNVGSACFVIDVADSVKSIFSSLEEAALIQKHGAGVGLSFSNLRGKDEVINSTGGTSSGVIAWLEQFNAMIESIKQGGRRRGALLISLPVNHPDIEDFVDAKTPEFYSRRTGIDINIVRDNWVEMKPLKNMNLSVTLSDDFMKAAGENIDFELISPHTGKVTKTIKAKKLLDKIINNSFYYGDPGFLFDGVLNSKNPLPSVGKIRSSNPCGEVLLPVTTELYQSCNLVALNLATIYDDIKTFNKPVDELRDSLLPYVRAAVQTANSVIEKSNFILDKVSSAVKKYRPIGIGIMDLATIMLRDEIRYGNNDQAIQYTENLFKALKLSALEASIDAVDYFGKVKKEYLNEDTLFQGFSEYKSLSIYAKYQEKGIANSTLLSVAPTGATGLLMGANAGGIEPIFSFKYVRNIRGREVNIAVSEYGDYIKKHVDEEIPNYFVTTKDLTTDDHYAIQKAASKYVDLAISKTINLSPNDTVESVTALLIKAWSEKIVKGMTIFNPYTEKAGILKLSQAPVQKKKISIIERGSVVDGETRKLEYHNKKIYITVNYTKRNEPIECFISSGDPSSAELQGLLWSLGYFISIQFKYGLPLNKMFSKMMNLKSFDRISTGTKVYSSLVEMIFSQIYDSVYSRTKDKSLAMECPSCHEKALISEGGCFRCLNCSYAKC
jgi:ribonucleoside-diphosphate reductase alpha chain